MRKKLADLGTKITAAANAQLGFTHPENPDWDHISFCQFMGKTTREGNTLSGANAVAIRPGKIDRSPTGTGCSARMALMLAKGEMTATDKYIATSITGSKFNCDIAEQVKCGGRDAILPRINGRAWITGTHQHMLDPSDPWPEGYRLSDTWPLDKV